MLLTRLSHRSNIAYFEGGVGGCFGPDQSGILMLLQILPHVLDVGEVDEGDGDLESLVEDFS
jgi:hypothetical protein